MNNIRLTEKEVMFEQIILERGLGFLLGGVLGWVIAQWMGFGMILTLLTMSLISFLVGPGAGLGLGTLILIFFSTIFFVNMMDGVFAWEWTEWIVGLAVGVLLGFGIGQLFVKLGNYIINYVTRRGCTSESVLGALLGGLALVSVILFGVGQMGIFWSVGIASLWYIILDLVSYMHRMGVPKVGRFLLILTSGIFAGIYIDIFILAADMREYIISHMFILSVMMMITIFFCYKYTIYKRNLFWVGVYIFFASVFMSVVINIFSDGMADIISNLFNDSSNNLFEDEFPDFFPDALADNFAIFSVSTVFLLTLTGWGLGAFFRFATKMQVLSGD